MAPLQVLSTAGMLSPPDAARLDVLARQVGLVRMALPFGGAFYVVRMVSCGCVRRGWS